jgi:hypothetical protein
MKNKKMDQAREREKGRQPVGWADEKINSARSLNPEE